MSSRFRAASLAMLLLLAACEREERESRGRPLPESPAGTMTTGLYPGGSQPPAPDPRAALYEGNSFQIGEGKRWFAWFNCSGCHANGGGGMGPALMDDEWRYGGSMEAIVSTIYQGRPNGMPSFRDKLNEQQLWQLAAYVRSMSGQPPKDVVSSRGDEISNTEPLTLTERQPQRGEGEAAVQGTAP
jgi:cytochrome c oxidase cbb3-type subunit 3